MAQSVSAPAAQCGWVVQAGSAQSVAPLPSLSWLSSQISLEHCGELAQPASRQSTAPSPSSSSPLLQISIEHSGEVAQSGSTQSACPSPSSSMALLQISGLHSGEVAQSGSAQSAFPSPSSSAALSQTSAWATQRSAALQTSPAGQEVEVHLHRPSAASQLSPSLQAAPWQRSCSQAPDLQA